MKKETKKTILLIVTLILVVGAVGLTIWSAIIMRNHEGYLEALRAARRAALPQIFGGIGLLVIAYVLTFVKIKK